MRDLPSASQIATLFAVPLLLALLVACGGTAQTEQPVTVQPAGEQTAATAMPAAAATAISVATAVPSAATAVPSAADTAAMEEPTGTLTVGQKELGPFMGHPLLAGNPKFPHRHRSRRRADVDG